MLESGRSDDAIVISDGSLSPLSSLEGKLRRDSGSMPSSRCIFKTPCILFRHNDNAFLPNYFSIGPMHHGKENLKAGEKIKIMYLNGLLYGLTTGRWPETEFDEEAKEIKQREILTELIDAVKLIKKEASACYAERDFAAVLGDEFIEVMVLDGCFIIELFRNFHTECLNMLSASSHQDQGNVTREPDDPIFSMSCMIQFLSHDLMLLENQIPWLVLQTLFDKTQHPSETMSPTLIELTLLFFATKFSSSLPHINLDLFSNQDIKHILGLLRLSIVIPSQETKNKPRYEWKQIRSITGLQEAGVKFKKVARANSILDIRFKNGILEIPSLLIDETTETFLRNLIAYEQCLPYCPPILTCYAKLLDNLIDIPSDLDILCKKEIFDNWMSPEDATQYFNKLYNDTYVKEFYYWKLCDDLNQYCKHWLPTWRAAYVHNYFTKPWAVAAQIYAVIMFVLTLWQTLKNG